MKSKQVILMRKDLGMRKGKIAAQAAHASMACILNTGSFGTAGHQIGPLYEYFQVAFAENGAVSQWLQGAFTKICVYVNSEEELLQYINLAKEKHMLHSVITDSGLTEFNNVPTVTCGAIGPDWSDKIDEITGKLPLY